MKGVIASGEAGLASLVAATHSRMTTEDFDRLVDDWITTARHPTSGQPFTEMVYQPRMETIDEEVTAKALDFMERMFLIAPAAAYVGQWLQSFREFPPRQMPGSFSLERVMEAVSAPARN